MNNMMMDKLKTKYYNEFFENNKELFKKNKTEYFRTQFVYVRKKILKEKYYKNQC